MVRTFGRTSTSYASMRLRPSTKTAIRAMAGRASSAFTLRSRWRTRSGPLLRTLRFSQPPSCLHTPSPCPHRSGPLLRTLSFSQPHSCLHTPSPCPHRSGPLLRTLRFSQPHSCLHTPSPCPQREYELSLLAIEPRLEGLPYWNWFIDKHACVLLSPRL